LQTEAEAGADRDAAADAAADAAVAMGAVMVQREADILRAEMQRAAARLAMRATPASTGLGGVGFGRVVDGDATLIPTPSAGSRHRAMMPPVDAAEAATLQGPVPFRSRGGRTSPLVAPHNAGGP